VRFPTKLASLPTPGPDTWGGLLIFSDKKDTKYQKKGLEKDWRFAEAVARRRAYDST
jgi:hypothetical protein